MAAKTKPAASKAKAPATPKAKPAPAEPTMPVEDTLAEVAEAPLAEPAATFAEAPVAEPEVAVAEPEAAVAEPELPAIEIAAPLAEVAETPPAGAPEITPTETPPVPQKEKPMTTLPTFDFSVFQTAFSDIQAKSKAALEKSTAAFGEYNTLAKGNVEALVEAGKILSAGLQELGTGAVAESRAAFETLTAEVKELASAKSPTEFLRLQSELAKKHIDHAVALGSKQSEAVLKLASDVAAPVSNRVAVAVEKLHKAA